MGQLKLKLSSKFRWKAYTFLQNSVDAAICHTRRTPRDLCMLDVWVSCVRHNG